MDGQLLIVLVIVAAAVWFLARRLTSRSCARCPSHALASAPATPACCQTERKSAGQLSIGRSSRKVASAADRAASTSPPAS